MDVISSILQAGAFTRQQVEALHKLLSGAQVSGTYTPVATGIVNVVSATPYLCAYARVGDVVMLSGRADCSPTAVGIQTAVRITLPIPSAISEGPQASGTLTWNRGPTAMGGGFINSGGGANALSLRFIPDEAITNFSLRFSLVYPILL